MRASAQTFCLELKKPFGVLSGCHYEGKIIKESLK